MQLRHKAGMKFIKMDGVGVCVFAFMSIHGD